MLSELLSILVYVAIVVVLFFILVRVAALILFIGLVIYAVRLIQGKSRFQRRNHW